MLHLKQILSSLSEKVLITFQTNNKFTKSPIFCPGPVYSQAMAEMFTLL